VRFSGNMNKNFKDESQNVHHQPLSMLVHGALRWDTHSESCLHPCLWRRLNTFKMLRSLPDHNSVWCRPSKTLPQTLMQARFGECVTASSTVHKHPGRLMVDILTFVLKVFVHVPRKPHILSFLTMFLFKNQFLF
jgi:hypothetical protein